MEETSRVAELDAHLPRPGVIRRAERSSEIVAESEVDVIIMIPGELYARAWLRRLCVDELAARLRPPVVAR